MSHIPVFITGTLTSPTGQFFLDLQVVMSHATSLYFDHPYEPHWEERGYYWATRFTDTQDTFGFMPMNYYANIDKERSGQPISRERVCGEDDVNCPPLLEPQNIVGWCKGFCVRVVCLVFVLPICLRPPPPLYF